MQNTLIVINNKIFLFFFFFFRFYIYKYLINKSSSLYVYILSNKNINNLYFYFYIFYLFLDRFKSKDILYFLDKKKLINFLKLKDKRIYLLSEIFYKNINLFSFNCSFFNKNINSLKVFFYFDFILKVDFFTFIAYKNYMNYFRLYKYNEYLNNHILLYKYPLLKNILRNIWYKRLNKKNILFYSELSFKKFFQIFFYRIKPINLYLKHVPVIKNDLFLVYNNSFLIKFISFIRYSKFNMLFNLFSNNIKIYFLLLLYHIVLFHYEEDDWVEIEKFRILSLFNNYWQLFRYGFNIPPWLYMLILIYIYKIFMFQNFNLFNIYNLNIIFKNIDIIKLNIINHFWYKVIKLVVIESIEPFFFLWNHNVRNYRRKQKWDKYNKVWRIILRSFVFDYFDIFIGNYNSYVEKVVRLKKLNLDLISWNIFYIGDIFYNKFHKYNILSIFNQLNIDKILYLNLSSYSNFIIMFLIKISNNSLFLINFLLLYIFIRDLFIKFLINKSLINKSLINFSFIKFLQNNQKKNIFLFYKNIYALNIYDLYFENYKYFYKFMFPINLIIIVYFYYILKYIIKDK